MDNREKFRALHREFGLEKVLSDSDSAGSYLRDMGFRRKGVTFLRTICSPESRHLRKRMLDREVDQDAVVERISDDTGYDRTFIAGILGNIRSVLSVEKKTMMLSTGRYEGEVVDGKRTSKGTYHWPNGDRYEGNNVSGEGTGKGTCYWANGDSYDRYGWIYKWAGGTEFIEGLGQSGGFLVKDDITYAGDYEIIDGIQTFRGRSIDDESVTTEEELHFQEPKEDCWQVTVHD